MYPRDFEVQFVEQDGFKRNLLSSFPPCLCGSVQ